MKLHDQPNVRRLWPAGIKTVAGENFRGKTIRLTHLDGKLPNLALMKLSAWFKEKGATVHFTKSVSRELFESGYDLVLGSSIFNFSKNAHEIFRAEFPDALLGGTGTEDATNIEDFVGEKNLPLDYSIYPHFKASIGFSQRGCRLNCSFCVVPKKEGKVAQLSGINSIWRGEGYPKQIVLLDNDFFGQTDWRARIQEILDGDFEVNFNQGINVRLIHKEGAEMLARVKYRDVDFKSKRIYTAWDNRKDEEIFLRGIKIMTDAGIKPAHIMVYFLIGYWPGETMDDIMYRFKKMLELGVLPYPMVYDNSHIENKRFQRWVCRRYYQFVPFEKYSPNSTYDTKDEQQPDLLSA